MLNRGIVLVNVRKFADAEKVLQDVIRHKDQDAVAHYFLGQALANLGKFDEAEKALTMAVRIGGEPAAQSMKEAHRILAIIYSLKGDKTRQIIALETYLKLAPTAPDAEQLKQLVLKLKG
jgi:tetratricopeptide (TPR) repeat protein